MTSATPKDNRRALTAVLLAALLLLGWTYRETLGSMRETWWNDNAFTYGFIVIPISLWLAWHRRDWLARVPFAPGWFGPVLMLGAALLWIVARGTGVRVVEQAAFVMMIPALVIAVLGWPAARVLQFPLAFLFFLVPVGRGIVPFMVQKTADIATWLLQISGVPVLRSHVYISIPDGSFEVAKACSGVGFLVTTAVLGVLYVNLNYTSWKKRILFMIAVLAIPTIANGVRVYITILVSHWTSMQFGPGVEHTRFAQVFFIGIMLLVGWVGLRWRDRDPGLPDWLRNLAIPPPSTRLGWGDVAIMAATVALLVGAPGYQKAFAAHLRDGIPDSAKSIRMPVASDGWRGPVTDNAGWRPLYRNGLAEQQAGYLDSSNQRVDAFVAVYALGATAGAEMISFNNVLFEEEHNTVPDVTERGVTTSAGKSWRVREVRVPDPAGNYLVWHWYMIGDRAVTNPFQVKFLEALAWITRDATTERSVTIATALDDQAEERLQSFVDVYPACVASGFEARACGE